MSDDIEGMRKTTYELMVKTKEPGEIIVAKNQETLRRISAGLSKTGQSGIDIIVNRWKSALSIVRSAITKIKGGAKDGVTEESVKATEADELDKFFESMSFDDDETFSESEAQSVVDDIENDLFGESSDDDDDFSSLFDEDVLGDF